MIGVLERNGPPISKDPLMIPQHHASIQRKMTTENPLNKYERPRPARSITPRRSSLRGRLSIENSLHSKFEMPPVEDLITQHRPSFRRRVSDNENSLYSLYETPSPEKITQRHSLRPIIDAPQEDMDWPEPNSEDAIDIGVSNNESSLRSSRAERITPKRRSRDSPLKDMETPETVSEDTLVTPQWTPSFQKRVSNNESSRRSSRAERITPRRRSLDYPLKDMESPETAEDPMMTPPRRPWLHKRASSNEKSFRAKYEMPPERITPRRRRLRLARPLDAPLKDAEWAKPEPMSTLYRHAKEQAWEEVAVDCKTHKDEACYVYPFDGTTALHLAVMSRVGYSFESEEKVKQTAPLSLVEELLQVYPDAAKVTCQVNSYTPLAYACLVPVRDCCLEETDEMVRLFLQYAPASTSVYTAGGLSAVDVHIVSYSQAMGGRTNEGTHLSGRTSTVVLRTLLEHDPKIANSRISNEKLGGPIEILYRCNSRAFMKLVAEYDTKRKEREQNRIMTTGETEDKNKQVLARISNWWVWRWTVLILKYDTIPKKKKGARFFALQAASGLVGCPLPILTLAMAAFPNQIKEKDEMHGTSGNLPLHEVCAWGQENASADPVIATRKGMAITALVQRYPNAVFVRNNNGESPLDLALSTGTTWDGGIRKLVRTFPASVSIPNSTTGLYPFMTAAAVAASVENCREVLLPTSKRSLMTHLKNEAKRDLQTVRTIYGLLRADPDVIIADEEESDDDSISAIEREHSFEDEESGMVVSSIELEWSGLLSTAQSIREESHRWAQFGDISFRKSVRNLNYNPEEDELDLGGYDSKRAGYL